MNNYSSFTELDKKDRVDFYIAVATICCALVFIIFYSFDFSSPIESTGILNSSFLESELDETIVIDEAEYVPVVEPIVSRVKEEKPVKINSVFPPIMTDSITRRSNNSEVENSVDTENNVDVVETELKSNENENALQLDTLSVLNDSELADSIEEITAVQIGIPESKEEVIVEVAKEKIIESEANISGTDMDKSCIIAVGLYAYESNANRMSKRLGNGGFDPVIKPRGSKFQVLVYHACNSETINKSLKNIRTNYASDAVVLVKK